MMQQNWWEEAPLATPARGPAIPAAPKLPPPRYPDEAAKGNAEAALAGARVETIPDEQDKLRAEAALARARVGEIGQTDDAVKIKQKRANLDSLVEQINRVEHLYRQTIEPTSGMGGFLDFLPTEGNKQFDAAGAGLAEQGLAAFRVPGVGAQSDTELRQFVQANKPSASDYDITIEEKLRQLRGRVDSTRQQLGLEPADWQGAQPRERADASTVYYGQPETGDQIQVATGATRQENNPALAGVNVRVNEMVKAGASNREILAYLKKAGMQDRDLVAIIPQLNKVREFKRKNPGYSGDYKVDLERWEVPNTLLERATPEAAFFGNAANALTLGNLDSMTGNPELTRAAMEGLRQQNPNAALAGTVVGGGLAAGGLQGAAGKLGLQGGRAALAGDAAFGAGYGAGEADDGNRLLGAVKGGALGVGGGIAGRAVASGAGRALTGTRDAATRLLNERGIPMTVGQIAGGGGKVGKFVKRTEDALESIPILGHAIRARRAEGVEGFDRATFQEALDPISGKVTAIGEQGVEQARGAVSSAYDQALRGVSIKVDPVFIRDMRRAMSAGQKLHPETAEDFARIIQNEIEPQLTAGPLTGEGYQALRQVLRQERAAWKGKPRGHQYGQALRQVEGALENLVRRRAPGVTEALNRADSAYGRIKVVEDAVGRGANTSGQFTAAQLGMAARKAGSKFGGVGSTTARPFFDLQRAGQDILPSQLPNSGTADRIGSALLLPALAGAGGGGQQLGLIDPSTAAVMVALGLPFTKAGQATFQRLLVQRPELVRTVGQQVLNRQRAGGLFGAAAGSGLAAQ
jgi:hypothetical protein